LVWGDVPTIGLLVGSSIVVASGLFLLWHEAQRRSPAPSASRIAESAPEQGSSAAASGLMPGTGRR
jgi:hypothetical protein